MTTSIASASPGAERDQTPHDVLGRATRRSLFQSKPGLIEQVTGFLALLFLTTGLPNEWFLVLAADGSNVSAGGPLIIAVFALLTGVLLVFSMKQPKMMFYMIVVDISLVLFSFLILFSTLWSENLGVTFRRSVALTLTTLLGIYFPTRYSLEELVRKLFYVFFITMLINMVWVFALPVYGLVGSGDYVGITTNRNSLGAQMVLACLVMVLAMTWRTLRVPAVIGLGGCFFLVLGTNSKTSLVSTILLMGMMLVFSSFRAKKTLFGAVMVSEVTAAVFGLLVATANLSFITDLLGRDITLTGRTLLWEELLVPIGERPWLGYGWQAFWGGWNSPAHEIWISNSWFPPTAHNAPLEILVNIGIVGLVLWAVMLARGLWRSIHYLRDRSGMVGLFPIAMFSYAVLYSVTEAGLVHRGIDWMLFVVALVETKRFMDRNRSQLSNVKHVTRSVVIRSVIQAKASEQAASAPGTSVIRIPR